MPGDEGSGGGRRASLAPTIRPDQALQVEQLARQRKALAGELKGTLLVIAGAAADVGTHRVIEGCAVLGRDPAGLALRDGQISRRHVSVTERGGQHIARDLGSTNGTLHNDKPLQGEIPLRDGDKITLGQTVIKFMLVDATEAAYLHRMERLAGTDELTGLPAKHRFDSLLAEAFRDARAMGTPLSLLMMDMDGLKAINDRHGHQMGAHTISQVGRMIGLVVQHRGDACRFGGDEFCASLPGVSLPAALQIGEQIRSTVQGSTFRLGSLEARASISIGVAAVTEQTASVEQLVADADRALYRAKGKGRDTVSD